MARKIRGESMITERTLQMRKLGLPASAQGDMAAYQDLKPSHPKPTLLDSTIMPYLTVVTEARKVLRQVSLNV